MAGQERSSGWFLDSVPDTMESSMQSDKTADHPLALDAITARWSGAQPEPASRCRLRLGWRRTAWREQEGRLGRRDRAQVIHDALSSA